MTTRNSYPRSTGFGMPRTSGLTTGHRTIGWMGRFCARLSVCVSTFGLYAGVALAAVPDGIQGDVLDCIVEPSVVVELGAATPGVLARITADRADVVQAGQLVAELESEVERAAMTLAQARAGLTTSVELRNTSVRFGERQEDRRRELMDKHLLPKEDFDRLQTEAEIARLQAREAEDERYLAQLEYRRAKAALERRQIRSPVAGVIVERYRSAGEYVEDQPVMKIANIDTLHVEVLAPMDLLGSVRTGMLATIHLQPAALGTRTATVKRVDSVADAASGTFGIQLALDNHDRKLPGGLRCTAEIHPAMSTPEATLATTPHAAKTQAVAARAAEPVPARMAAKPASKPPATTRTASPPVSTTPTASPRKTVASIDTRGTGSTQHVTQTSPLTWNR